MKFGDDPLLEIKFFKKFHSILQSSHFQILFGSFCYGSSPAQTKEKSSIVFPNLVACLYLHEHVPGSCQEQIARDIFRDRLQILL